MARTVSWILIVTSSLVWSASSAGAERNDGLRVGVGMGLANLDFDGGFAANDFALTAFAAYDLNRYFGIEAAYVDGGSPRDDGVTVDLASGTAMAVGSLPLVRDVWSLFVRAGVVAWSWESAGVKREGTDFAYGAGTAIDLARIQLRVIGDFAELDDAHFVHLSLQAAWKF
jgi:Outer membrane protein beta-barrel domain